MLARHSFFSAILVCATLMGGCSQDARMSPGDAAGTSAADEAPYSYWQLDELASIGSQAGSELHRVRGAAILNTGGVAIADAGNHRVALFSSTGAPITAFGKAGDGPGEYRNLVFLSAFGDTIITFDNTLARVTVWAADGSLLGSHPVPAFRELPLDVRAATSTDEYIATTRPKMDPQLATGIYTETVDVVRFSLTLQEVHPITTLEWRQLYQHVQGDGGVTVYMLPFLGQSHIIGGSEGFALARFSDKGVELSPTGSGARKLVGVPLTAPPFDSRIVEQYRDSLIGISSPMFPTAEPRLRQVFGPDFPSPVSGPALGRAAYGDGVVWLEQHPGPGAQTSTWYAIEINTGKLMGAVALPASAAILDGKDESLLVHLVDDLGVENVVRFGIRR